MRVGDGGIWYSTLVIEPFVYVLTRHHNNRVRKSTCTFSSFPPWHARPTVVHVERTPQYHLH